MANEMTDTYWESKVLTAPSHKLHLMLIEGALRFGRQAKQALERNELAAAKQSLTQTMNIATELLAGVKRRDSDINNNLVNLYSFVTAQLADAWFDNDLRKLSDALGLLEYERDTWQLVCEQHGATDTSQPGNPKIARLARPGTPPLKIHNPTDAATTSLSFEA